MQMVILCGGLATRLGDITNDTPKSMIKIKGKPFLEYQIENLKKHSVLDIVLCVGHLSDQIKDYFKGGKEFGVDISYSYDGNKPLGPIGALKNAEKLLHNNFFIMYGDSYVFVDFNKIHKYFLSKDKLGLMVVYQNFNRYDKSNLVVENGFVTSYSDDSILDKTYIDYGVSLFNKKVLDFITKDRFFSTKDLYPKLILQNELLAYELKKRFYQIGTPDSLMEFKEFVNKNF